MPSSRRIRGRSAEERRAVRQAETKPLVEKLKAWLETRLIGVSEKTKPEIATPASGPSVRVRQPGSEVLKMTKPRSI
jgi:hypothetical protein